MPFSIAGPSFPAIPSMEGINRAADRISNGQRVDYQNNAAEAAIAGRFDTSIGEATISIRNATNQISSLQKADQSLGYASDLIAQVQGLSVQAGNGALSDQDLGIIKNQSQALVEEAFTTLEQASFNGNPLFGNTGIDIERLQAKLQILRDAGNPLDQETLSDAQDEISTARASVGGEQNAIVSRIENLEDELIAAKSSRSNFADTDFAEEFVNLLKEEILFKANVAVFNHRRLAEESIINLLTE